MTEATRVRLVAGAAAYSDDVNIVFAMLVDHILGGFGERAYSLLVESMRLAYLAGANHADRAIAEEG